MSPYEINSEQDIINALSEIAPTAEDFYPDEHPVPYIVLRTPRAVFDGDDYYNRIRKQEIVVDVYVDNKYNPIIEKVRRLFNEIHYEYAEQPYSMNQLFQAEFTFTLGFELNKFGGIDDIN